MKNLPSPCFPDFGTIFRSFLCKIPNFLHRFPISLIVKCFFCECTEKTIVSMIYTYLIYLGCFGDIFILEKEKTTFVKSIDTNRNVLSFVSIS